MKVELNSANINQSLERDSLSFNSHNDLNRKEIQNKRAVENAGFMLDIGGMGPENAAYGMQSELKSAEELMAEVGSTNAALQKDMMTVMSNTMSREDYAEFAKNGYSMSDMSVEEQVTSLDKLKAKLAEAGTIIEGYNDDLSDEELSEIAGSKALADKIAKALKENDLPVNGENAQNMVSAMNKAEGIKPLSENAVKYMVTNRLEPSADNLYKAEYSSGNNQGRQLKGYYQDNGGYFQKKADTLEWDRIKDQAEKIVKEAGYKPDRETMDNARWLIEQGIPLTSESLKGLGQLRDISFPLNEDGLVTSMAVGIADGKAPSAAALNETETMTSKALSLIKDTEAVTDEALHRVVDEGEALTIRNLKEAAYANAYAVGSREGKNTQADTITNVIDNAEETAAAEDNYISAKRLLEETRLAMTYEANLKLMRQGISIDTMPLSRLVDRLKEAERSYYDPLLINKGEDFENRAARAEALDTRTELYKQTVTVFEALRSAPAESLARVDTKAPDFTARRVFEVSEPLRARAESTYEALMTAPRGDMGDSIKKAFRNVDDILSDNGYELNDSNRRAVRILGYAEMEINPASIDRVKEADQALRQVIEQMTPAKTLELIRNGDNPLDENIFDLNRRLKESSPSKDTEKYSRFLVRLERKGDISEAEKDAFIGMYRLFRQIEKSDGKLLGNVLDAGGALTLKNLLSASRSNRVKGMDYGIDDDFGGLEKLITKGSSISDQIERGFKSSGNIGHLLDQGRELMEKLGPDSLPIDELTENSSLDDICDTVRDRFAQRSVQALMEDYEDDQAELLAARQVEDRVIEILTDGNIPVTPDNILAQDVLMNQRGKTFNSLMKQAGATEEGPEKLKKAVDKLHESFDDITSAQESYEELKNTADELLSERADSLTDAVNVRELGLLHRQIGIAARNARNESYEVPVEIDGEWTSINLKLVRDSGESGTVTVAMETEGLGRAAAKLSLDNNRLNGYITTDSKDGLKKLSLAADELSKRLTDRGIEVAQLNCIEGSFDGTQDTTAPEGEAAGRELYEVAKCFISVIREL